MYIIEFAKSLFKKQNIGSIIYFVLNLLVFILFFGGFSSVTMALFAVLLYAISLTTALSPIGEWILRLQYGCKKIKRKDYSDRLMPLFNEVYERAKQLDSSIPDGVQLFMCNDSQPNAFATGRKTICLTKGFMSYTDDQIKGTLAHELGHIAHKDTDFLLLITVGNMLMSFIFVVFRTIVNIVIFMVGIALESLGTLIGRIFIDLILVFLMWCWTKIGLLLVMHTSRENEYGADKFAFELGYGNALAVVLDSFDEDGDGKGLWANLHSTHPDTDSRIARLQELGVTYTNSYGHNIHAINANPQQYGYEHSTPPIMPAPGTGYNQPLQESGYNTPLGAAALASGHVQSQMTTQQYIPQQYMPQQQQPPMGSQYMQQQYMPQQQPMGGQQYMSQQYIPQQQPPMGEQQYMPQQFIPQPPPPMGGQQYMPQQFVPQQQPPMDGQQYMPQQFVPQQQPPMGGQQYMPQQFISKQQPSIGGQQYIPQQFISQQQSPMKSQYMQPQNIPQRPPVSAPQNIPQRPPVSTPQSIPQRPPVSAPQSMSQRPPVSTPQNIPQRPPVPAPQNTPQRPPVPAPQNIPQRPPVSTPQNIPQRPPVPAPQNIPQRPPVPAPQNIPQRPPVSAPQNIPQHPPV